MVLTPILFLMVSLHAKTAHLLGWGWMGNVQCPADFDDGEIATAKLVLDNFAFELGDAIGKAQLHGAIGSRSQQSPHRLVAARKAHGIFVGDGLQLSDVPWPAVTEDRLRVRWMQRRRGATETTLCRF